MHGARMDRSQPPLEHHGMRIGIVERKGFERRIRRLPVRRTGCCGAINACVPSTMSGDIKPRFGEGAGHRLL